MKLLRTTGSALALAMLAACSGGGGASPTPVESIGATANPPSTPSVKTRVKALVMIPLEKKRTAKKTRKYVSPNTQGLVIEVDTVASGTNVPVSYTAYDLTSNSSSSSCTQTNSGNQCTIYFDAPATSSTSSDAFFIYAYDTAQTPAGSVTAAYAPVGNLLSEDIGTGTGDLVGTGAAPEGTTGVTNSGITANANNSVTFVLFPVVASVEASLGAPETGPLPGSTSAPLVLSVPGTGGTSNAVSVDGYDGGGDEIMNYLFGSLGDDVYVNPIGAAIASSTGGTQFRLSTGSLRSALADSVTAAYMPATADVPTSATTAVPYGTANFTDSFTGGFSNTASFASNYPKAGSTPTPTLVAPLYAFVSSFTPAAAGFTGSVYALQAALPTGAAYTLGIDYTIENDCTAYTAANGGSIGTATAGAQGTDQRAVFAVTAGKSDTGGGDGCTLDLSDGISTVTVMLASTEGHANRAQPIARSSGYAAPNTPFSFSAHTAGDGNVPTLFVESASNLAQSATGTQIDSKNRRIHRRRQVP